MWKAIWAAPLAALYGLVVTIRHWLFDRGILRSTEFDIPIVCVGNLTVGGTGKTPVTEYLIEQLSTQYRVAVLSRGYKRRTRGFVLSSVRSSFREIGDEPKQMKLKYPQIPMAVCEKRVEGIRRLRQAHPEVNLVILDDAFQHRYVEAWVNVLLMDYNRPIYQDSYLPMGRLRDSKKQLKRAQLIVATKCPVSIQPIERRTIGNNLQLYPYQSLFFSHMRAGSPEPLFPDLVQLPLREHAPVIALTGIAAPQGFLATLGRRYSVVESLLFPDHHTYRMSDMRKLQSLLRTLPEDTLIVTTEKDAVKLVNRNKIPTDILRRLYYLPIRFTFLDGGDEPFLRKLFEYVRKNHKYSLLHPE